MFRRIFRIAPLACLVGLLPLGARAHDMTITQVVASFDRPGMLAVKIDLDLTKLLGSPEAYFALSAASPQAQSPTIEKLLPAIFEGLQLHIGEPQLKLILQSFTVPRLSAADFDDPAVDKFTTLNFIAVLPASRDPLYLAVPDDAQVAYPVAFTVQIPAAADLGNDVHGGRHERQRSVRLGGLRPPGRLRPGARPRRRPLSAASPAPGGRPAHGRPPANPASSMWSRCRGIASCRCT